MTAADRPVVRLYDLLAFMVRVGVGALLMYAVMVVR